LIRAGTFKAAIFDMDGLLIDSERAIMRAWLDGAQALGFPLAQADFVQVIGRAAREGNVILAELLGGDQAFHATAAQVRAALQRDGTEPVFPLKTGAATLLQALHDAGVPCAVASSSRVAEIRHRLGHADVDVLKYFKAVSGGDEVTRGKPDPALYLLAAARLGVEPEDCIAFEDSENGARAAQSAGIRVVIVPDLKHPSHDIAARAHGVIGSLADALEHVPHWFPRL
jgi:HAD superfamily hydrolase (TIGR01509 family)